MFTTIAIMITAIVLGIATQTDPALTAGTAAGLALAGFAIFEPSWWDRMWAAIGVE